MGTSATIVGAFGQLHDTGLIGDTDLLDICYRFAGELVDVEKVLERRLATSRPDEGRSICGSAGTWGGLWRLCQVAALPIPGGKC